MRLEIAARDAKSKILHALGQRVPERAEQVAQLEANLALTSAAAHVQAWEDRCVTLTPLSSFAVKQRFPLFRWLVCVCTTNSVNGCRVWPQVQGGGLPSGGDRDAGGGDEPEPAPTRTATRCALAYPHGVPQPEPK